MFETQATEAASVPSNVTPTVQDKPRDVTPIGFESFWQAYPRKVGKGAARRAFASAIRKTDLEAMLAGIGQTVWAADERFRPHPATWLNGERWGDQQETTPKAVAAVFDPTIDPWGIRRAIANLPGTVEERGEGTVWRWETGQGVTRVAIATLIEKEMQAVARAARICRSVEVEWASYFTWRMAGKACGDILVQIEEMASNWPDYRPGNLNVFRKRIATIPITCSPPGSTAP